MSTEKKEKQLTLLETQKITFLGKPDSILCQHRRILQFITIFKTMRPTHQSSLGKFEETVLSIKHVVKSMCENSQKIVQISKQN